MVAQDIEEPPSRQDAFACSRDVESQVASPVSVEPEIPQQAMELSPSSQVACSRILHGIILPDLSRGTGYSLVFSSRSAAIPLSPPSVEAVPVADVVITSTASATEAGLMRLGFSKAAAVRAVPWVPLLGEDAAPGNGITAIYATCRRVYARVVVRAEIEDLMPHPNMVLDIEKAFDKSQEDEQVQALRSVLRRWGSFIATHVDLGCALVSTSVFETATSIPLYGAMHDPHNARALLAAETYVHNALQCRMNKKTHGSTEQERTSYEDLSHLLSFKVLGGSPEMQISGCPDCESLENPNLWTTISVDGIYPIIDLLRAQHADLYQKCQNLVLLIQKRVRQPPEPPVLTFPGRLTGFKYGVDNDWHMSAFLQQDLPPLFDFYSDFTLTGWILSGYLPNDATAISVECRELHKPIVQIGEWQKTKILQANHCCPNVQETHWLSTRNSYNFGQWYHATVVYERGLLSFYLAGELQESHMVKKSRMPLTNVRLCIGRSASENKQCNQWDGAVENVNLWARALDKQEIIAEADRANMPGPAGWGVSRYP